ncbi:enoyl-CoA hydratase/isomerase family protein [Leptospira gomenensis]|uniref:Enoyl-CoA hydratase/isomerase family protein n=1 Tax=Leptospira gomenensis TaxID=2484974 RepID=A0A5F1YZU6_9LEPT|nr:enoyl-CoA hydratase/isomerase family protein [Leptospira gomenensis]TGK29491.1 enoyl-CoA hydratase/isomerase family protein [Leptospira gomenensis]TGK44847.1 enoyl-CoA hydratase/isomerase family protein [Leptospira gomenensis]TGK64466.1 enoyl-CoA hydratase/isomerase family protein [Leptospira gomenensis]
MGFIDEDTIDLGSGNKILILSFNNPESRNSMTREMGLEFKKITEDISQSSDKQKPRSIILTGKNGIFSAGGNFELLKSFSTKDFESNKKTMFEFYNLFLSVRKLDIPVICAANGHAIGAGLSLAFACDIRVFANEGKYQFNFVKLGIHPGMGSSYIVKELFGTHIANRLLFMAEMFNGEEALRIGLCNDSVPQKEVLGRATEIAIALSESAPLALRELKKNTYNNEELTAALKKEAESQARNFISEDFKETIKAIEQKRKPEFKGV